MSSKTVQNYPRASNLKRVLESSKKSSARNLVRFFQAVLTCANRIEQFEAETKLTQYIMQTKTPRLPVSFLQRQLAIWQKVSDVILRYIIETI